MNNVPIKSKDTLAIIDELRRSYQNSPTIRGLISLLSIATLGVYGVVDAILMAKIQSIGRDRAKTFFDKLAHRVESRRGSQ